MIKKILALLILGTMPIIAGNSAINYDTNTGNVTPPANPALALNFPTGKLKINSLAPITVVGTGVATALTHNIGDPLSIVTSDSSGAVTVTDSVNNISVVIGNPNGGITEFNIGDNYTIDGNGTQVAQSGAYSLDGTTGAASFAGVITLFDTSILSGIDGASGIAMATDSTAAPPLNGTNFTNLPDPSLSIQHFTPSTGATITPTIPVAKPAYVQLDGEAGLAALTVAIGDGNYDGQRFYLAFNATAVTALSLTGNVGPGAPITVTGLAGITLIWNDSLGLWFYYAAGNVGTVTSIVAGTGLSGGTITGAGTIAVVYGTSSTTSAVGNDSRITGALSAATAATTYAPISLTVTTSASSFMLVAGLNTMTGTTASQTATLPAPSAGKVIYIKNQTNQTWTIASNSGSQIYTTSAVASTTMLAGDGATFISNSTVWSKF